ncbi:MAG: tyrosine-type recombinase/integrase [Stackebrandtia sp.]
MSRPAAKRKPRAAITESGGWLHGFVTVRAPNGTMARRHRMAPLHQREQLEAKLLRLEDARDANESVPLGEIPELGPYMRSWLTDVAPLRAEYSTVRGTYVFSVNIIEPRRGGFGLDEITPSMVNDMYNELLAERYSTSSVNHVHTTLKAIFAAAITDGYITTNVIKEVKPPTIKPNSPRAYDDEEIDRLIDAIQRRERNRLRWFMALLGARQGEALGAKWRYLNRDTGMLAIVGKAQRRTYTHGCSDPAACAAKHHRTADCSGRVWEHGCDNPRECAARRCNRANYPSETARDGFGTRRKSCPQSCTGHARACPQRRKGECKRHKDCRPCPSDCVEHAVKCPKRRGGVIIIEDAAPPLPDNDEPVGRRKGRKRDRDAALSTKTPAGQRRIAFPPFVMDEVGAHERQQQAMRIEAGSRWTDHGLIITDRWGRPVDPRRDWEEWGEISDDARVEYREPHANRKAAATVMLKLGMDRRIVMAWFGWDSEAMLKTYQDVPEGLLIEAAGKIGDRYRPGSATRTATTADESSSSVSIPPSISPN